MRQNPHVRIRGGCALKAREAQAPEMATAARPSQQPRSESCVASGNRPLRSVDRETVGRNASERTDSPEIDRGWSGRPHLPRGKAASCVA